MKRAINSYANFVSNHAVLVLMVCIVVSIIAFVGIQMMETQSMDYQDMLPDNYDVIKAFDLINEDFGGTNSGTVVIEIDNEYMNSNEHASVIDPEVVRYSYRLENYISYVQDVEEVNGFGQLVYEENGMIPNNINEIRESKGDFGASYVSEDESMMLIKISFSEDFDSEETSKEIIELIEEIDKPMGIKVSPAGEVFEDVVTDEQMGPDMNRTSMFSMAAIVIILLLLFRSAKGVAIPIMTIIFGVLWTMGFLGLVGSGLSSMTSGAISMIMGIGIDFGIQVMNRYNNELKQNKKTIAMTRTLNGILVPIFTTALACLIGFRAMSLGELSMMGELGNVMSYGVVFCMIAAITIVPSLLVIFTREKKTKSSEYNPSSA